MRAVVPGIARRSAFYKISRKQCRFEPRSHPVDINPTGSPVMDSWRPFSGFKRKPNCNRQFVSLSNTIPL